MAIIVGTPNMLVSGLQRKGFSMERKPLFRFDNNGEYQTEDEKLIARAAKRFEIKEYEKKKPKIESKKSEIEDSEVEIAKEKKEIHRKCKICGEEFDSLGLFMAHMKDHKKKGES